MSEVCFTQNSFDLSTVTSILKQLFDQFKLNID